MPRLAQQLSVCLAAAVVVAPVVAAVLVNVRKPSGKTTSIGKHEPPREDPGQRLAA